MKEQEQERDVNSLDRQSVSVAATVAFEQSRAFEFTEIVTKLVESVLFRGKLERGDDGLMNLFGGPAADGAAVMQENLQQSDDPRVMDFDAGIANGADEDRQSDLPQQGKIHMHVETLRLEAGETVRDDLGSLAHLIEMVQTFSQAEIIQVVG